MMGVWRNVVDRFRRVVDSFLIKADRGSRTSTHRPNVSTHEEPTTEEWALLRQPFRVGEGASRTQEAVYKGKEVETDGRAQ